jgi:hypothetical protein
MHYSLKNYSMTNVEVKKKSWKELQMTETFLLMRPSREHKRKKKPGFSLERYKMCKKFIRSYVIISLTTSLVGL